MTDLNKEREAFEANEFVKTIIHKFEWSEEFNSYQIKDCVIKGNVFELIEAEKDQPLLNGAWFGWQEKAKAQAVPTWISVDDHMPESLRNVLVLIDANPVKNQNQMVAHFIPKFTEEYHGDDDWYDYDEERGCGYIKEGWYANTAYIGDEYSSYFIEEKVTHWKPLKEASESGAEG
ncbi:hypothetical protein OCUAc17_11880 [Acinetobacter pittii]|uniref:DUF551 domain-containing protein n=1 Tax=Acinetobacter TaxID=469 RepID=UPI0001CF7D62|nr:MULTISPECIES: DUF551 domain-containing protein [Acinetobacter]EFF86458.1 hypothetical protein HMPREF0013_01791 [Acinetobacter sp. SH024]MEB3857912.1 DUF551 domain-containing protein [Acinetobacter pittii]BCZ09813.1 hypothetical protein OCUAc17_11880 [Acinetobacter pittii]